MEPISNLSIVSSTTHPESTSSITKKRLDETIKKIYNIYSSKDSKSVSNKIIQAMQSNALYQDNTAKILKWIGRWLAKIGCNNRYSLHEELIQLQRIIKAVPVLEKEQHTNELAKMALQILKKEGSLEKLTPPQKMLVATAAKDWLFLCELGEEEAHFDPFSIKNSLFPPKYNQYELSGIWQSAIYECILDKQSDLGAFQKLVEIGTTNRFWGITPGYDFNSRIQSKIRQHFAHHYFSNPKTPLEVAILHNRPEFVQYLNRIILENTPIFGLPHEPNKILDNLMSAKNSLELVGFFDVIRKLNPERANGLLEDARQKKGTAGFLLQKALLKQKTLTKEERETLEQLVSIWIPEREIIHLFSPPDFAITFQGKVYPCHKETLKKSSTWIQSCFDDPEIEKEKIMRLENNISAGPYLKKFLDHVEGLEEIDEEDLMYGYFGLTNFTPRYVQNFEQLFDKNKLIPISKSTDWNAPCSDPNKSIGVHSLVFERSVSNFKREAVDKELKKQSFEIVQQLIQLLYTRTPPPGQKDFSKLLALCQKIGVKPAILTQVQSAYFD